MHRILLITLGLLTSLSAHAEGPNYQVFPQLKNLKISYHVETRKKQTTIYVTNHEKSSVVCDAMLNTNKQEKIKKQETLVAPGKTISFSFIHGIAITDVRIYLMCEARPESETEQTSSVQHATEIAPVVIEEDIGNN